MRKVRSLLSVLLVCCLLVNVVPVKSSASGALFASTAIPASMVAASCLIGLGVMPGSDQSIFDNAVNAVCQMLIETGKSVDGFINLVRDSAGQFFVDVGLVDLIRGFMWEEELVFYDESFLPDLSTFDSYSRESFLNAYNEFSSYPYAYAVMVERSGKTGILLLHSWNSQPLVFSSDDGVSYIVRGSNSTSVAIYDSLKCDKYGVSGQPVSAPIYTIGSLNSTCCPLDGLTLGAVGYESQSFSDGYVDWADGTISVPSPDSDGETDEDTDYIPYVPLGLGTDYSSTVNKPQTDIQEGVSEYEIEDEGSDSETEVIPDTIGLTEIWQAIKSVPSAFEQWFKDLLGFGQSILDAVLGIPHAITDILTAIFVPDQAYVEAKVDVVYAQFPFIQSIIATGEELKGAVSGSSGPPVIYVDLGLAPSGDFGSQKVLLTDFSWYEPYKQRVDTLLSAALWALFGWRMYLRLPSIISGEGGIMIASERAYRKLGDD